MWRDLGDGDLGVWVSYDDRRHAKALPGARWDKHLKCWRIVKMFSGEADALCHRLNGTRPKTKRQVELDETLTRLFSAVPQELRKATYKALSTAWHPDRGGDTATMQTLNRAWSERPFE